MRNDVKKVYVKYYCSPDNAVHTMLQLLKDLGISSYYYLQLFSLKLPYNIPFYYYPSVHHGSVKTVYHNIIRKNFKLTFSGTTITKDPVSFNQT